MSTSELNRKARELLEIQSMIAELEAEAEALRDTLKGEMIAQGVEILMGDGWKAAWKNIQSSRFDAKAFRAENPETAARYMKQTTTCRFTLTA